MTCIAPAVLMDFFCLGSRDHTLNSHLPLHHHSFCCDRGEQVALSENVHRCSHTSHVCRLQGGIIDEAKNKVSDQHLVGVIPSAADIQK